MKRCSITFSSTGIRLKTSAGTHCPWRWPERAGDADARRGKPKNHSRRSRQKAATPADQDGDEAPAEVRRRNPAARPRTRQARRRVVAGAGSAVDTKFDGRKPPITPTLGQTRPERCAGPSSANQTGQASSTKPTPRPMASALAACGGRPPQLGRSVTSAAATSATTQMTTTTATMASSSEERKNCAKSRTAEQDAGPERRCGAGGSGSRRGRRG